MRECSALMLARRLAKITARGDLKNILPKYPGDTAVPDKIQFGHTFGSLL